MKISEIGEFGLVDRIAKIVGNSRDDKSRPWQQLLTGIGDDCAAWHVETSVQLATVDALVENVHFTRDIISWTDLGWKSLAICLSDIAAMGGIPEYALVSLALSSSTEVDDVDSFYRGMIELARQHGVAIIGGDTDNAPYISATVTLLGNMGTYQKYLSRTGARPGDLVAVTGYPGMAAAGLYILKQKFKRDTEESRRLKRAFSHPIPRVLEGQFLLSHGIETAIDVSDGIIADLKHICIASKVGARINTELVPESAEIEHIFSGSALELALTGGEDYELIFTGNHETMTMIKKELHCPVSVIGEITAEHPGQVDVVDKNSNPIAISKSGWEHFIS